ncbi:MAG: Methyltransferase corrinoid protein [Proteobacteria bacterium]|nr:Methyltransferase corrinoid protein [Pseudomonadota bacterium]
MQDWSKLYDAIVDGDDKTSARLTREAIEAGEDPSILISATMVPAMAEVGRLFEIEEYFVPELLLAGRAMKAGLELLRPILAASGVEPTGRIVIGTVKGDLHDIGKNLVVSMMEGAGFEVIDLGIDVPPETFIEAVRDKKPQIVGMSALLTVTMPAIKTTIEAMVAAGVRDSIKIMIGGAPVTEEYAREVGADAYGENASVAATIAKRLCAEAKAA